MQRLAQPLVRVFLRVHHDPEQPVEPLVPCGHSCRSWPGTLQPSLQGWFSSKMPSRPRNACFQTYVVIRAVRDYRIDRHDLPSLSQSALGISFRSPDCGSTYSTERSFRATAPERPSPCRRSPAPCPSGRLVPGRRPAFDASLPRLEPADPVGVDLRSVLAGKHIQRPASVGYSAPAPPAWRPAEENPLRWAVVPAHFQRIEAHNARRAFGSAM